QHHFDALSVARERLDVAELGVSGLALAAALNARLESIEYRLDRTDRQCRRIAIQQHRVAFVGRDTGVTDTAEHWKAHCPRDYDHVRSERAFLQHHAA